VLGRGEEVYLVHYSEEGSKGCVSSPGKDAEVTGDLQVGQWAARVNRVGKVEWCET